MAKIVSVKFGNNPRIEYLEYSYFTDIKDLKKGEEVVVETDYGTVIAYFIGSIEPNTPAAQEATSWIIQKVDYSKMYENKAKQLRLQEIRKIFMEKKAAADERHMFEIIADADDYMQTLFKEYNALIR